MTDPLLNVGNQLPGIGFVPATIELLDREPELNHKIAGQVLRFDLAALFSPQPDQGVLVITHDDPGVGAADKKAAVYSVNFELCEMIWHDDPSALVLTLDCGISTCDNSTIQCL